MNNLTSTIMLSPETHSRLKEEAQKKGQTITSFFNSLLECFEPVMIDKDLSNCSQVVNVSEETRNKAKLKAVKAGVTMGRYVEGLLEAYCKMDILD